MEVIKDYFRKWQNSFRLPDEPTPPEPEPIPPPPPVDPCAGLSGTALKICRGEPIPPPPPEPEPTPPPPPPDPCEGLTGDALKICKGEPVPPPPSPNDIPPRPAGDISAATKAIQDTLDELRRKIKEAYFGCCTFFGISIQKKTLTQKEISLSELITYV